MFSHSLGRKRSCKRSENESYCDKLRNGRIANVDSTSGDNGAMHSYLFTGKVLPERAQMSFAIQGIRLQIKDDEIGIDASIILNQVAVQIHSTREWDILDLRNIVKTFLLNQLAAVGYLKGYAYDLEVTRVFAPGLSIDYVFGIDIPCLAQRGKAVDLNTALPGIIRKASGPDGIFINRCLNDLALSMKHADDTAFYCYRAIESLKRHCAIRAELQSANAAKQWEKFRQIAGCNRASIDFVKSYADPLRHGDPRDLTSDERGMIFKKTWDIVENYLDTIL